jgi:hypothetical protein
MRPQAAPFCYQKQLHSTTEKALKAAPFVESFQRIKLSTLFPPFFYLPLIF